VLHAGRPKTGSSSIQHWLEQQTRQLRDEHGIVPVVARSDAKSEDRSVVETYKSGKVTSKDFVGRYRQRGRPRAMVDSLVEGLDRLASRGTIVVSAEEFARLLKDPDEGFVEGLNRLAEHHSVRLAYYVRPQHTALEATWCQMGFRHRSQTPSEWVLTVYRSYRYFTIAGRCREAMPNVEFHVRPFRKDLLTDGDVVTDFATVLLGMASVPGAHEIWSNPGLPLEAVNLLHHLPRDVLSLRDSVDLSVVKRHLAGWTPDESDDIVRSRVVLQHFCHETFEKANQRLIRKEGWAAENFVPPVAAEALPDGATGITELDRLWAPSASQGERELVYLLLKGLLRSTGRPS